MTQSLSSRIYHGVRDWSVKAKLTGGDITIFLTLGRYKVPGNWHIDPATWPWPPDAPGNHYEQQQAMERAAKLDPDDDSYCNVVRLCEEAVKAVNEIVEKINSRQL